MLIVTPSPCVLTSHIVAVRGEKCFSGDWATADDGGDDVTIVTSSKTIDKAYDVITRRYVD